MSYTTFFIILLQRYWNLEEEEEEQTENTHKRSIEDELIKNHSYYFHKSCTYISNECLTMKFHFNCNACHSLLLTCLQGIAGLITVKSNEHISSLSVCFTLCWLPLNDHCCCKASGLQGLLQRCSMLSAVSALLCFSFSVLPFFILLPLLQLFDNNQRWGRWRRWRCDVALPSHVTYLPTWAWVHRGYVLSVHTHTQMHTQTHSYFML